MGIVNFSFSTILGNAALYSYLQLAVLSLLSVCP